MALDPKTKRDVQDSATYIETTLKSVSASLGEVFKNAVESAFDGVDATVMSTATKDFTRAMAAAAKTSEDLVKNKYRIAQGLTNSKNLEKQINELAERRLGLERRFQYTTELAAKTKTQISKRDREAFVDALGALDVQEQMLRGDQQELQDIEKKIGLTGKLTGALGKLPFVGKFLDTETVNQNMRKTAAEGGSTFNVLSGAAKDFGGQLVEGILDPMTLTVMVVKELVEAFKMVDSAAGDTAKALGVSYDSALKMTDEMNNVAMSSNDILVNTKNLVAAQNSLNKMFGTTTQFSGKMAEDFVSVQERLKLSDEAMESFTKLGLNNGIGLKENLGIVDNTVLALNRQNKTSISFKAVQESIGKAGAAFRLTMKGSAEEMTKSVFNAKRLGLEMSDIAATQSSLLDFESSIGSELEAELLTGKELNLEKARAAALTGDTATLAEEMAKNIGTAADFGKMNVLAQDALAKSFGKSREELAGMLEAGEQQVKVQALGFDNMNKAQEEYNRMAAAGATQAELDAKFKDQALQSQMQSVSQQERMAAITTKLKEVFVSLMEPLMPVLEVLGELFEGIVKPLMQIIGPMIKELSSGLVAVFSPIKEIFTSMSDLMTDIFGKGEEMGDTFKVIGKVLGSLLTVVFVPIKAIITYMVQGIKSAIQVVGGFVDIFQGRFGEGMKKIATGVIGFIVSPFQFLMDMVTGSINAVIKGINNIPGVNIEPVEINLAESAVGLLPMAKGGITTGPTKALVGEAGPEAVIPLREFYAKIDELIVAVKQGQNIYIGANKLNEAMGVNLHPMT
ncbi:hypothetical protein UFOVP54_25 [uncultured Caudovirales phage]|uniref:Uncharacterized protein n=1 Tax=uncultured Caudovirales phage TaxID=2100421 RepID=A0A6J5KUW4_9CAUD|nr:hypothetical protein UFOVP54_25 [uncultured Caudovirales phage]